MGAMNPTVQRIQLGMELRQLREHAGTSRDEVAEHLGWYPAKVSKVEQGTGTVSKSEVEQLIALFGLSGDEADRIRRMGLEARRRGSYGRVSDWARSYVGMEAGAAEILAFGEELIPGLMQTADYARAVAKASVVVNPDSIDQLVSSRTARYEQILERSGTVVSVVLGEASIRRCVGGPTMMKVQLKQLRALVDLSHVILQVLPFSSGAHAAMGTSFTLLRLSDTGKEVVYLEDLTSSDYLDKAQHARTYRLVHDRLRIAALGQPETAAMLDRAISEL